ncbi:uncharacterized protein LOC111627127 [Centruroides sculpturatus]|uniref:uncharacterized protein LOC111627127 n=1 Tax=Centruroides sculpturatus TaxID=218467 RepID=UPI000C6E923D|nr:uncharacterized protein LOC111627127 [Centruroides sculpturatus]
MEEMAGLRLFFVFFLLSTASCLPVNFGFGQNWEQSEKENKQYQRMPLPANFNPIQGKSSNVPSHPEIYNEYSEHLFREYLEQEKRVLETRLNLIYSLFTKVPYFKVRFPKVFYPEVPYSKPVPFPTGSVYTPYAHRNNIVSDKSSGKNLYFVLNMTGFADNEISYDVKESRIIVQATHEDQFYTRELIWTFLLPMGTDADTIQFNFDGYYLTISGILPQDVSLFSASQTFQHNLRHKFFYQQSNNLPYFQGKSSGD